MGHMIFILGMMMVTVQGTARAAAPAEIEIVFDASGSMNDAPRGIPKMEEARQALFTIAGQIDAGSRVGLRVFGVTPVRENIRASCTDSKLLLPIGPFDAARMTAEVQPLKSYGMTALGYSLELAGGDFNPTPEVKKTIILISDGEETCGKDPVAVIEALKQKGIQVTIHAIGFDASDAASAQLRKLAEITQGSYREAKDAAGLEKSLKEVVETTKLLTIQRGQSENLLAASRGARIISSSSQNYALFIDGDEKTNGVVYPGEEVVFAFKDNQPVLLEKFAVPVFQVGGYNPGGMKLLGSTESPDKGFSPVAEFTVANKVFFGNVYQEFKIDPPAAVRYLKVVVGKGSGGEHSYPAEWHAYGKYLTEEEFQAEIAKAPKREFNVLAAENGGQFIAGSRPAMANVIDGKAGEVGAYAEFYFNEEAIFGFEGGKTANIAKVAVPILQADTVNCKTLVFSVSDASPVGPWTEAGSFETTNLVFAGSPFQEYAFPQSVKAKFLKVKVVDAHGGGFCRLHEVQATGTLES